ncbi:MAG TPA: hypothetical protein VGJ05_17400 [Fimbriiglobus sp.]|jgi:hypothetical protein
MDIQESIAQNLIPFVAIVGGMLFVLGTVWVNNWRQVAIARHNVELKQQLLAKGMSSEEIINVINAGKGKSC